MGQFKPMVKMMTTEPTVELKLKKGGSVNGHKNMKSGGCMKSGGKADASGHSYMNGGISAALAGEPMIATKRSGAAPKVGKPSMAARRAAMKMAGRRGMKEGGETAKEHKAEMSKMKGLEKELKSHASKPASKAHKGLKTGGVVKGQGGYKTGGVVLGQGGYKTGGVALGQGGYKKGGKAKKMAMGGLPSNSGQNLLNQRNGIGSQLATVAKPKPAVKPLTPAKPSTATKPSTQTLPNPGKGLGSFATGKPTGGLSKPSGGPSMGGGMPTKEARAGFQKTKAFPSIDNLFSGRKSPVMKKGGSAKKYAEGGSVNDGGRPQKMPQGAKKPSTPVEINKLSGTFKKGGKVKKYADGGMSDYEQYMSPEEQMKEMRMRKAMKEGYEGVRQRDTSANEALLESLSSLPRSVKNMLKKAMRGQGAVTDTETTVSRTVVPARKRGGKVCK